jgi:hypothetical protein
MWRDPATRYTNLQLLDLSGSAAICGRVLGLPCSLVADIEQSKSDSKPAPKPRHIEPLVPVTWFLGLEVFSRLRGIVLDSVQHDFNLRDWMDPQKPVERWKGCDELWFDYLADIGDGGLAMASIAYHLERSIELAKDATTTQVACDRETLVGRRLPRGEFLFIGGDYAYPASDVRTLHNRVFGPFERARDVEPQADRVLRPVYGIPANHDYYDDLIGFNHVMRAPIAPDHKHTPSAIPGYVREQVASYVRLALPHDWEFWGLDLGTNGLDFRQTHHFRPPGETRPTKLIVCTQKPPIVLDEDHTDDGHREALCLLRLSSKFDKLLADPTDELGDHLKCRLDLSGDVHHYARYGAATTDAIPAHQFAGVVSGGGGAFLHPTRPTSGRFPAVTSYPEPGLCVRRLASGLLQPWRMLLSGHAWLIAGLIALAVFAGYGSLTGLPPLSHGFPGAATVDRPNLVMAIAVLLTIALPIVWFAAIRPRVLGKRGLRRILRDPLPTSFGTDTDDRFEKQRMKAPLRDLLDKSPLAGFVWVTFQIALIIGVTFAPPWLAAVYCPGAHAADVLSILAVIAFAGGGVALAMFVGGGGLAMFVVGLVHAAIQLSLPIALLVFGSLEGIGAVLAIWGVATLIVLAARTLAVPALRLLILAIWIGAWLDSVFVLFHFAPSTITPSLTVGTAALAIVVGMVVCIHQFGWYLLVAYLFGGHNNEAGAAIRCQDYKQWIRFHIGRDGVLTGYVIGIDRAVDPKHEVPRARLVDVFQVRPK